MSQNMHKKYVFNKVKNFFAKLFLVLQKIFEQAFQNPFRETFFIHHILLAVRLHSCRDKSEVECYEEDGISVNMMTLKREKSIG
jgi:hypothetical protein